MGIRGELFSTQFNSSTDRRSYFFNVKENRRGDVYLTLVESKKSESGSGYDRHQIVLFQDDFERFVRELNMAIDFAKDGQDVAPRRDFSSDRGGRRDFSPERGDRSGRRDFSSDRGERRDFFSDRGGDRRDFSSGRSGERRDFSSDRSGGREFNRDSNRGFSRDDRFNNDRSGGERAGSEGSGRRFSFKKKG